MNSYASLFPQKKTVIGVIHLPPLLGYKNYPGRSKVIEKALADLHALEENGAQGVLVENENDQPHQVMAPPETIAIMTVITQEVVKHAKKTVVGAEFVLNDPKASLAIAKASGAKFIRTDYFVDRMAREEYGGEMTIDPDDLMAYRKKIQAEDVLIFADIQVKYAVMLEKKTLAASAVQAKKKKADAIIITGTATGSAPTTKDIQEAKQSIENFPVLIGSGLSNTNAASLLEYADGAILATSIKTGEYIDGQKVTELVKKIQSIYS